MAATALQDVSSMNDATKSNVEREIEKSDVGQEIENQYPHGFTFVLLTIGLMAVVLVLGLDNYIIGKFFLIASIKFQLNLVRNCYSSNNNGIQHPQPRRLVRQLLLLDAHVILAGVWTALHPLPNQNCVPYLNFGF